MQHPSEWRLAEAKNRFSELVNNALAGKPQTVRRREEAVVVISEAEYLSLTGKAGFKRLLLNPPEGAEGIFTGRDSSPMRDAEL